MTGAGTPEIERKATAARALLESQLARHGRLIYANSLGAEAMVLADIIGSYLPAIDMFSIDTGRLHAETYELRDRLQRRARRAARVPEPQDKPPERLAARQ